MQNFDLLRAVGKVNKPVLLKRGLATTIDEFINARNTLLRKVTIKLFFVSAVSAHTKEQHVTH